MSTWTSFDGTTLVAHGPDLAEVIGLTRAALAKGPRRTAFLFDDETGRMTDVDADSTPEEVLGAVRPPPGRGRPKLGVVSREVSLLPRHWEWLGEQPGGASATIRRLVDAARKGVVDAGPAQDAAWRFLSMLAPDVSGAEEVSRALYAGRYDDVRRLAAEDWPRDVREHFLRLVARAEGA